MIVNTDAGTRPLRGGPVVYSKMIPGGNGDMMYSGYGAFPNRIGFNGFPDRFSGMGADDDSSVVDTIDSILSSGAKLGTAYTQYMTRNKPTVVVGAVPPSTGIPMWVWIAGGAVLVGGAYFLFFRK